MKTGATNKKIRELISMVNEEKLIPRPEFQRRLVWTRDDKNHFLDSILKKFPFPEIYLADGEVDVETGTGTQLLVDGLQRVSTIIQYFKGDSELKLTTVPPYKDLSDDEKKEFLQYEIAVRDLGSIGPDLIVEIFKRLNATKYSLKDIEINNAVYAGALRKYAEVLASNDLFVNNGVFTALDYKRMGDLSFALSIIVTMISGYSNREDSFAELLGRYNDDFPIEGELNTRINRVINFITECGFEKKSRVWRKADLFTLIVELDRLINLKSLLLQPSDVLTNVEEFFAQIDDETVNNTSLSGVYYKATIQASNDRVNRVRRGVIMSAVIQGMPEGQIRQELIDGGLLR